MALLNVTINGQKISAESGSTVMAAAKQAGIQIPTLCDHPALAPIGACRMCLVEIKGQRILQPACTFPITDGMEVQTESPAVVKARRFVLDLLFSERNHYCMYCEMSGNCELQTLGYRYGLDHWTYPTYTKRFPVDATRKYFLMDHNRCILCRRCVRACSDLVANHTLGLRLRGASTMLDADMNVPFGDSTCISCGTCLQVCPTGALIDRRSAFMGRDVQTEHIKSICDRCSIGCGMEIITRGGNVLRIEGDWDAPVNKGLLCQKGRFEPLDDHGQRITMPYIKENGRARGASWDEALQLTAQRIGTASAQKLGVLTTTQATNEALYLLDQLFKHELGVGKVALLNTAVTTPFLQHRDSLADIQGSDVILVVGADPLKNQPVASMFVKRAVDNGARLIVADGEDNGLTPFAHMCLKIVDLQEAVELASRSQRPMVLFNPGISDKAATMLKKLEGKACFVALEPGANSYTAAALGLSNGFDPNASEVLYVLASEQQASDTELLNRIDKDAFVIVQASFKSALTERADVVLPSAIWSERDGSLTNTEGRVQQAHQAVQPEGEAKPDWEILSTLARKLGKQLGASLSDISARAAQDLGWKENLSWSR